MLESFILSKRLIFARIVSYIYGLEGLDVFPSKLAHGSDEAWNGVWKLKFMDCSFEEAVELLLFK